MVRPQALNGAFESFWEGLLPLATGLWYGTARLFSEWLVIPVEEQRCTKSATGIGRAEFLE